MITIEQFHDLALSFPETEQNPHFDRAAFKVKKRRIFATLHEKSQTANLKLQPEEQASFCDYSNAISPVDNKWGLQGWTTFDLKQVDRDLLFSALETAYNDVLKPKK